MSLVPTWPVAVGTLVIGLAVGAWGMHTWDGRKYDKLVAQQAAALALANAANQKASIDLQDRVDTLNTDAAIKDEQHAKDLEAARADVRSGRERLSIRSTCSANTSTSASTATGTSAEERADIVPEVADAIISIAGSYAKDLRQYNQLLDQYNAVCK